MFEGVIFDLDGLLLDSEQWHSEAWNEYLKRYELRLDPYHWEELSGLRSYEVATRLRRIYDLPDDPLTITEEFQLILMDRVEERHKNGIEPMPGVRDTIEMFQNQNIRLAIATSEYKDYVWLVLEKMGLDESFDVMVSGDIISEQRPSPLPLFACAETFALHPANCLAIAKDRNGVESAINAGMKVICIPGPTVPRWKITGADVVLPSLEVLQMNTVRSIWFEIGEEPRPQLHPIR